MQTLIYMLWIKPFLCIVTLSKYTQMARRTQTLKQLERHLSSTDLK